MFDTCTNTEILSSGGRVELAPQAFNISHDLSTASLVASVELFDFVSETTFTVDVDVNWTGGAISSTQKSHDTFTTDRFRFTSKGNGTIRDAVATGTVSNGCPNWTEGESTVATMTDEKILVQGGREAPPASQPLP